MPSTARMAATTTTGGIGWYRKLITLDTAYSDKNIYLTFDAASTVAKVYLNGSFIGEHRGAFGAFCFDVTSHVKFGAPNLLAVQVNNARDSTIAPLRGDFTIFGGLYRGVHLLVLNTVSISPLDYASSGVYMHQQNVSKESAELAVQVKLRNATQDDRTLLVRYSMIDDDGNETTRGESSRQLKAGSRGDVVGTLVLNSPRLWHGLTDPYLYTMVVDVYSGDELVDRVAERFGVRFFSVDATKGFFLNGEPYRLYGVNRHQDRENMGWGIGPREHREDFALIREIGANAVRLAHYQHANEFYALCDSGGLAVWAELALVDFVNSSPAFLENCKTQLNELIKQNFNHPSIFCWAIFNELLPDGKDSLYEEIVTQLNGLAKELDPTRFTACASRSAYDGSVGVNRITDLIGYNVYRGWYEPDPEDFAVFIDGMRRRFPKLKLGIGEYGAGAGIHTHEFPARLHDTRGKWHPEEWQSIVHEVVWKAIAEREFIWGSFVWNMFDFASDTRSEGEKDGINDKGLVTFDRKTRKDAFYWYKANWNPEPMVHITEKRFTPRPAGRVTVKVYSNCESVELLVDGKSLGTKESKDRIFLWDDVNLAGRTHVLATRAFDGSTVVTDSCVWRVESEHKLHR